MLNNGKKKFVPRQREIISKWRRAHLLLQAEERRHMKQNQYSAKEVDGNGLPKKFFMIIDPMTASAGDCPRVTHQKRTSKRSDHEDKIESRIIGVLVIVHINNSVSKHIISYCR